jgi:ABC transport system ATP-binding/permease protein
MTVLSLSQVSLAYGHKPLLDQVDFQIAAGERVCLVGRNGAGKSTLFRVISGSAEADDGEIWRKETLRISHLEQEAPVDGDDTIYDLVAGGLGHVGELLAEYHQCTREATDRHDAHDTLLRIAALQQRLEALDGWNIEQRVATVLTRLALPADKPVVSCSGGVLRRCMLARALVSDPDLLLLDEPTNHMDIEAITWLEEYLLGFRGALIFITHDRTLARHLATRVIELDRGRLISFPGDYDNFLRRKDEMLASEARANAEFDRRLADHETWIRQGIKARRTRNEGRVRKLLAMREERAQRRERAGSVSFSVDSGEASGRRVVDLRHVSFRYDGHCVIRDLSTTIMRGDRIGIVGPNGSGKSTLLRLILGELQPDSGEVVHGSRLQIAYFDQHRELLDPAKTVRDNISAGSDHVSVRGRSRHVVGYLKDFLFPPERIDSPVRILSGGERNRLLLARLFTKPANMMVLDEPTNDLDVDTLELLEDLLADYDGTLLLVSHDRTFLDNVVSSTLVFEGDGRVGEYVGGYEDWIRQRASAPLPSTPATGARVISEAPPRERNAPGTVQRKKLGYRERQELEALPARIEQLEAEQQDIEAAISGSRFYQQNKAAITATLMRLEQVRSELEQAYMRWDTLDSRER